MLMAFHRSPSSKLADASSLLFQVPVTRRLVWYLCIFDLYKVSWLTLTFISPVILSVQFNRPLSLCKDSIQTRNRKSSSKSKKKGKKSPYPSPLVKHPLLNTMTGELPVYPNPLSQLPNYIISTQTGNYPSQVEPTQAAMYNSSCNDGSVYTYASACPPHVYSSIPTNAGLHYENGYGMQEDVKPRIAAAGSAFSILPTSGYSPNNCGSSSTGSSTDSGIDASMANGSFHSSPYSAFSPFGDNRSSPPGPHTPQQASPSLV